MPWLESSSGAAAVSVSQFLHHAMTMTLFQSWRKLFLHTSFVTHFGRLLNASLPKACSEISGMGALPREAAGEAGAAFVSHP